MSYDSKIWFATLGVCSVLYIGGSLIANSIDNAKQNKEGEALLNSLNSTLVEHINEKGYTIKHFNSQSFQLEKADKDYLCKISGNAMTVMGDKIDFMVSDFKIDEQQFVDLFVNDTKGNLTKEIKPVFTQNNNAFLKKLVEIVNTAELIDVKINENVALNDLSFSDVEELSPNIILNVTNPKITETTVKYSVCYTKCIKQENGEVGLITTFADVEYPKTAELEQKPAMAFVTKEKPNIKITEKKYTKVNSLNLVDLENIQQPTI